MHTLLIAYKNLRKNFLFYGLYLLSVSLVITVYTAFTLFSMNRAVLGRISAQGRVESMCSVISVFLMAFVIFFMAYSNRFFLKRRTKELGIYALLGYRKATMLYLLTFENILICCGALCVGLVAGAFMHKGIVAGITALLKLSIDGSQIPFLQIKAMKRTVGFVAVVVFVLCVSNGTFLFRVSLMGLVRFEKKAEKNMEFHGLPALLGFVMIAAGYGLALDIFRGRSSIWFSIGFYQVGMLALLLVTFGTVFFISAFLPFVMQMSKEHKKSFYTADKIITTPNFIYRIRSNARTLIMLTLLSAATLTVSSVMALSLYYPIAAVTRMAPSELEFRVEEETWAEDVRRLIGQYAPDCEVICTQTAIYKITSSSESLPMEYRAGTAKGDADNQKLSRAEGFECISYSQYLALLKAQGRKNAASRLSELNDNECILVKYQPNDDDRDEAGRIYMLDINGYSMPFTVRETTLDNPFSFANSIGTLIVSDSVYGRIESGTAPKTTVMSINGEGIGNWEDLYGEIEEVLDGSPYLQGHSHRINEIFSLGSSTFLLIGFFVILFFIATGSILYFNNISSVSDSHADYEILCRMGYSDRRIMRLIRKQVFTFFCIPFIFGLIDCVFATVVYKTGLMQNLLGKSIRLYVPTMIAIGLTAVIYLIYYWVTVRTCRRIILGK